MKSLQSRKLPSVDTDEAKGDVASGTLSAHIQTYCSAVNDMPDLKEARESDGLTDSSRHDSSELEGQLVSAPCSPGQMTQRYARSVSHPVHIMLQKAMGEAETPYGSSGSVEVVENAWASERRATTTEDVHETRWRSDGGVSATYTPTPPSHAPASLPFFRKLQLFSPKKTSVNFDVEGTVLPSFEEADPTDAVVSVLPMDEASAMASAFGSSSPMHQTSQGDSKSPKRSRLGRFFPVSVKKYMST